AVSGAAMGVAIWLGATTYVPAGADVAPAAAAAADGPRLYARHCQACHGEAGDGNGPAARVLYPRPRNFRGAKFRLVTTSNGIPTDRDLLAVITRGMPGSAMFSFGHLSDADRAALVAHVRTLIRAAFVDRARRESEVAGEKVNLAELEKDAAD